MTLSADPTSVERHLAVAGLAAEWDALADRLDAAPWLRAGWAEAWWRAFGSGRLEVLAVRRGGRLCGVLPVRHRHGAVSSPTNWHSPAFGILAEDADARGALLSALLEPRPRSIALHFLDSESPDIDALAGAARTAGYTVASRVEMRSPYLATTGTLETLLGARPPGRKLVSELRRRRRLLEAEGDLSVRVETLPARVEQALESAFAVESSGWKGREGSAMASLPETRHFYTEVVRWAAERGTLRLAFLDLGDRPIACDLMLEEANALLVVKRGYDEAYRRYGPGNIMMLEALNMAFAAGLESLELLGSEEPYKLQWTGRARERLLVQAFAPTPLGRVERLAFLRGRPAVKRAAGAVRRMRER